MIRLVAFALWQVAAVGAAPPLLATWTVSPESVTVAQPFLVTVSVRVPRDETVIFSAGPDSGQVVEAVDPAAASMGEDSAGFTERRATYRLVAWETGRLVVPLAPVQVGRGRDAQRLEVRPEIRVASVIPSDTAKSRLEPKPALTVMTVGRDWWFWAYAAAVAIALLASYASRRRARRASRPPPPPITAAEDAVAAVDALGLLEAGETSRYVRLTTEALRGYLGARVPGASRAQTTDELVGALRGRALPIARIAAVLAEVDQVQFARRPVSAARARELAREVHALLTASEEAFARDLPAPPAPGRTPPARPPSKRVA